MKALIVAICRSARPHDNLLSIDSAGINRVANARYPAPMKVMVAVMVEMSQGESKNEQQVRVRVEDADGGLVTQHNAAFRCDYLSPMNDPGELVMAPVVFDCRNLQLPAAGRYQVVVDSVDGNLEGVALSFRAVTKIE